MELTPKKKSAFTASDPRFTDVMVLFHQMVYYTGNYTTYVRTKQENDVNQMKAYNKQQEEIAHIKKWVVTRAYASVINHQLLQPYRFIASAGTYANLVKQAKSNQKVQFVNARVVDHGLTPSDGRSSIRWKLLD
jgi:ATPase subunit of ABC transporter with duplicated ATPase domains